MHTTTYLLDMVQGKPVDCITFIVETREGCRVGMGPNGTGGFSTITAILGIEKRLRRTFNTWKITQFNIFQ
ncbi:hypothetical protein [Virgibacillus proomii]|uniref:hypothetical protein n=1 Tax=Virgibacillus proomii TaxID=84407 RepID=UPI001C123342|nr:hypothetical protein [Virgibacillus proomii]MBU5265667.1 hypothetical protein [Virgibacillus proomii]